MDTDSRKDIAVAFLDAHAQVDQDTMSTLLAPEARFHSMKSAGVWAGMPAIITGASTIAGMLASRHGANGGPAIWQAGHTSWEHHLIIAEGDYVVVHTTRRSLTVDGADYENPYVCIFHFEGSQIIDLWEYLDSAYAHSIIRRPEATTPTWRGE
jgi:ketosteroid isomerase-like protein